VEDDVTRPARSRSLADAPRSPALVDLTDGALLEAVLARSEPAWRELLRRFRPLIFRCIYRVAQRRQGFLHGDDANAIFSDTCFALLRDDLRRLRAWDPARSKLSTWLGLISMHAASDHLRAVRRRPQLEVLERAPELPAPGPGALEAVLEQERRGYLSSLLADLSARDRRFVELYYGRGLTPEEVAAAMRISVKTVYSKKNKLRVRLEELVRRDPEAPGGDAPTLQ
jgi:RNA polymerase sigma-70 factor (ECF subfamily)